jgi:hypothetical protein
VAAVRSKTESICEIDLADEQSRNRITMISFDRVVSNGLIATLKGNGTQSVLVSHVLCYWKTQKDKQFQTNSNPLRLKCNEATRVTVTKVFPVPRPEYFATGAIVSYSSAPRGLPNFADCSAPTFASNHQRLQNPVLASAAALKPVASATDSSSSSGRLSSQNSLIKRTPFLTAPPLAQRAATNPVATSRAQIVELKECRQDEARQRILRCTPACQRCLVCDVDATDPSSAQKVAEILMNSSKNRGQYLPTQAELFHKLCDNRNFLKSDTLTPVRHVCRKTVPDIDTKRHYIVHPRCAHLSADYQNRECELDRIRSSSMMQHCFLCDKKGATVRCYHPDCNEMYHVICALFSNGYVNFGADDPFRPVPACPRHTLVTPPTTTRRRRRTESSTLDAKSTDEIAFDATEVLKGDLRDPDEDEEESLFEIGV